MQRLMTTAEVADLLRVPIATVRSWKYRGRGPKSIRVGRHVRYSPEDVARWLEEQRGRSA